jgi:histidinol-phosphate aminotransferase
VVVDEAYVDFVAEVDDQPSLIPLIDQHPNLVVLRTCSKSYSLAGARVGFLFADAGLVAQLMKVKDSYNLNVASQAMALAAMADGGHLARMVADTLAARAGLEAGLVRFGWNWPPPQANFLLCRVGKRAPIIQSALRDRGLLVRWWDTDELRERLRITVGKPEDHRLLLGALDEILAGARRAIRKPCAYWVPPAPSAATPWRWPGIWACGCTASARTTMSRCWQSRSAPTRSPRPRSPIPTGWTTCAGH